MVTGTCYVVARRLKATLPIRHEVAAIGPRTDLAWTLRYVAECDPMRTFAKVCCRAGRYSANLCAALLLLQNWAILEANFVEDVRCNHAG